MRDLKLQISIISFERNTILKNRGMKRMKTMKKTIKQISAILLSLAMVVCMSLQMGNDPIGIIKAYDGPDFAVPMTINDPLGIIKASDGSNKIYWWENEVINEDALNSKLQEAISVGDVIDGHEFRGWSSSVGIEYGQDYTVTRDDYVHSLEPNDWAGANIYASWSTPTYNVNYSFAGDVPSGVSAPSALTGQTSGTSISVPATPNVPAGYSFNGWYYNGSLMNSSISMPSNNITIQGRWSYKNYSVKYNVTGDIPSTYQVPSTSTGHHINEAMTAPSIIDTDYPGYSFSGWSASGGVVINNNGSYTMPAKTITLTGTFTRIISHAATTFTGDTPPNATALLATANANLGGDYYVGDTIIVPNLPSAPGYNFGGWTYKGNAVSPGDTITVDGSDISIVGNWSRDYSNTDYWWTVTYDGNGDSDSPVSGTIPTDNHEYSAGESDDNVTMPSGDTMTRPGYIFEGWTKDSGIAPLNPLDNTPSDIILAGQTNQITTSTTYYAVWRINYNDSNYWWKVIYDKNGVNATGDVPNDEHYYSVKGTPDDNVVTVKDKNTLYNHKYKFIGWSKEAQNPVAIDADLDSLGFVLYNADGTNKDVTISANTTLYAVWQEASLGIKDDSDTVILSYDQAKDAVLTGGDSDKSIDKLDNVSAWTDESGTLNENAPYEALDNKLGTSSDDYTEAIHQLGADKKDGTVYIRYGMTEDNDYKEDVRVIVSRSAHPVYNDDYTIDSADEVTLHANEVPNANIDLVSAGQAQAWTNDGNNTPTEVTVKDNALLSDTVGDYTITYVVTADPTLTKDTIFHVIKTDADGDGVPDTVESGDGTNSDDSDSYKDTDGDEVPDYVETNDDHTNPDDADSYKDTDGDEVPDYVEEHNDNTNPSDDNSYKDTDGDGVPDYVETHQDNTDPKDNNSYKDTDGDEVPDYVEEHKDNTDPKDNNSYKDTDKDEVPDYVENKEGSDPKDKSDYKDTDGDGVPDYVERREGTNPKDKNSWKDTDKGGVSDYAERMRGSNVNDPSDDFPSTKVTKTTKVKTGDVNNIGLDGLLLLVGLGGIVTALTYKKKRDKKAN
jgi:uncharacterized repeat protein (TIGR02543 family)